MKSLVAALMMLFAPWPGGGWPGDPWPGSAWPDVSGTGFTGNEATLTSLYALTNIPMTTAGNTYYFSCDAGGDYPLGNAANSGLTSALAFANWGDAAAAAVREVEGVTLRLDAGDGCFTFSGDADVIDYDTSLAAGVDTLLLRIDSSTPGSQATITQSVAPTTSFLHVHGTDLPGADDTGGRIIVQDIELVSFTRPGLIVDNGVDLLALNYTYRATADGTGEDMLRPAGFSQAICINCVGTSFNEALIGVLDAGSLTMIGTGLLTKSTPAANSSAVVSVTGGTGTASASIVGHRIYIPPTSTVAVQGIVRITPQDNFTSRGAFARTLIHGADASIGICIRTDESNVKTSEVNIYESTVTSCDRVFSVSAGTYGGAVGASTMRRMQWNVFDGGGNQNNGNGGMTNFFFPDHQGSLEGGTWDVTNNIVNERGGALASMNRYRRPDNTTNASVSVAAFRTDVAADTAQIISAFANTLTSGTFNSTEQFTPANYRCIDALGSGGVACVAAVSDAIGGTADGFCDESTAPDSCQAVVESAICDVGQACGTVAGSPTYTIPLYAPVWAEAIGSTQGDLTALRLNVTQYGGR